MTEPKPSPLGHVLSFLGGAGRRFGRILVWFLRRVWWLLVRIPGAWVAHLSWLRRLFEDTMVLMLYAFATLVLFLGLAALVVHVMDPKDQRPIEFAKELKDCATGLSGAWVALVALALILFLAPVRRFIEKVKIVKVGPVEASVGLDEGEQRTYAPPTGEGERT